jgi:hypothetical protein
MNFEYKWQEPYAAAVLETDRSKLAQHISQAATAINARVQELHQDHMGTPEERTAIEDALRSLELLRKEIS